MVPQANRAIAELRGLSIEALGKVSAMGFGRTSEKILIFAGTAPEVGHFLNVTAETPLPSKRPVIRSRRPPSSQAEAFFSPGIEFGAGFPALKETSRRRRIRG
jgi:hypothetical protein